MVQIDKRFNINKYFKSYKPILREVFLEYYDDEYTDIINNAFNNFSFVGYLTPVDISNIVYYLCNEIGGKLEDKFLEVTNLNTIPDIKFNAFYYSFKEKEKCPFYKILQRKDNYERDLRYIFKIDSKDPNYEEKIKEACHVIDSTKDVFFQYQEIFEEQIKPYQEYISYANNLDRLEEYSKPQYINYFIKTIFSLLSKSDKEFYLANQDKFASEETAAIYFRQMQCFHNYISRFSENINFKFEGYISYFSKENEDKMSNPEEGIYIKKYRIKYFNNLGIDLGKNYEDYLNNPEVQRLWPNQELIETIEKARAETYELTIKDFFLTMPMYQENKDTLENTGFTAKKETPFLFQTYLKNQWHISPNYIMNSNQNVTKEEDCFSLHPIIVFSAAADNGCFDKNIIHELNHLVEERIKNIIKTIVNNTINLNVTTETGFNCKQEEYIEELKKTKYELFNETINEIIADEITKLMHDKGIFLFTDPNYQNKKEEAFSVYNYSKPFTEGFFNEFKKDIIRARMTGNRVSLYKIIDEENFDELNDLINEFYLCFEVLKNNTRIKKALEDLEEGNTTEDSIMYQKFLNRSASILEKMKTHAYKNIKQRKLYI